jgi:hypothetical protein
MTNLCRHLLKSTGTTGFALAAVLTFGQDSLFISRGTWEQLPEAPEVLRLNASADWTNQNAILEREAGMSSSLVIVNADSTSHEWALLFGDAESITIEPGDTAVVELPALSMGTYRLGLIDGEGGGLGAQSMLKVGLPPDADLAVFHWNLCDWETDQMASWSSGTEPDPNAAYVPNYFSINEQTYPSTLEDPNALISIALSDTCWIAVANHGQMDHVLHFHGFHVEVLTSNLQPSRIGWSKDTVPIKKGEGMTLQLVANQVGTYPVHDHNLIAVTNAGFYPGGMLTQIIVVP